MTDIKQNSTFYGFSEDNYFVYDPRGFNTFIHGEASTFLTPSDPRLLLSTIVTNISYTPEGVVITNEDGSCISADYAICTFSVGVLQSDLVTFDPPLPLWKRIAIETFQMGIYTKIFFQFPPDRIFWNSSYQYFLYASSQRGYYPVFQPLDLPEFLPGSGIFIATVVTDQSRRIEAQSDDRTKSEILVVLREMFGAENVPEPIDFMYPRWGQTPWARGSYSNWPPGLTLEGHQNLRANVDRLWFAGEATSQEYYGYLQGAWLEGKGAGERVATLVNGGQGEGDTRVEGEVQGDEARYEVLMGTTTIEEYGPINGWYVSSFQEGSDEEVDAEEVDDEEVDDEAVDGEEVDDEEVDDE
jgi:polyamine oxidase